MQGLGPRRQCIDKRKYALLMQGKRATFADNARATRRPPSHLTVGTDLVGLDV